MTRLIQWTHYNVILLLQHQISTPVSTRKLVNKKRLGQISMKGNQVSFTIKDSFQHVDF